MTRQHVVTTGFILAGLLLIPTIAASQQADPQAGLVRQRAPGVPMAPRPGELAPDIVARGGRSCHAPCELMPPERVSSR